ncbi:TIGR02646 family protein [Pseudanabaena sp. UWO311]|uniref:retron system putative HNH endonuclease n=1 Tax=Pseudanabaena sp. UWO311 TaxID=2487337 RepID=UPI001157BAAE|nr:retron system putative HNH endonuclease [Pseudanabaena sp. UWO311]TYQ26787.1 TIGR02646 family protein [Pseudanabaena sp. UWO311]
MRYIKIGQEPQSFTDWKSQENDDWKPTYKTLRGQIKAEVHDALLAEQGYTCCYCGMSITSDISHIEHLQPQNEKDPDLSTDLSLAIDFNNLLASCGFSDKSKMTAPEYEKALHCLQHCGCKRGNNPLSVSPLQVDCADFFRYTGSGEIRPAEEPDKHQSASETIQTLNLNYGNLVAMREEAIDQAVQGLEELTAEDLAILIKSYEQPNQQAFSFAIAYILKQFLNPKST